MIGVCRDVTSERTADHALRISRAQIPLFVERAPISVAMFDRDMVYLAASRRRIDAYGRGWKSLAGLSHYELHPDIPDRWKAVHRGVMNGEFHTADDDRWVDSEGQERWVRWAAYPWTDEVGGNRRRRSLRRRNHGAEARRSPRAGKRGKVPQRLRRRGGRLRHGRRGRRDSRGEQGVLPADRLQRR